MAEEMRVGIVGAAGRMGRMLVQQVQATAKCRVAGASEVAGHPDIGSDAGTVAGLAALGVPISDDAAAMIAAVDCVLDFTAPAASATHARLAAQAGAAFVLGTTGLAAEESATVEAAAKHVPVVWAPNFSIGVTLLTALTERVSRVLGPDAFDIEIQEMHHRHKVDAPSGTALGLGRAAAAGRGVALKQVYKAVRDGHTGARPAGEIGFATLRGGDVVGDHSVIFAGEGERLELVHKAQNRGIFAAGAVRAALWTRGRKAGLYSMFDVLGLER